MRLHYIYANKRVNDEWRKSEKIYIIENKAVSLRQIVQIEKTRGGKIGERSLNVIENKWGVMLASHYIAENKPVMTVLPL
jgi:hypothetical protein